MFRNIPVVTKNLLIINFLAFVATWVLQLRGIDLTSLGSLHYFMASDFHLYQFLTYQFLHANLTHIFFNMFALYQFGSVIESVWGSKRFSFYYIVCGLGAALTNMIVNYYQIVPMEEASNSLINNPSVEGLKAFAGEYTVKNRCDMAF